MSVSCHGKRKRQQRQRWLEQRQLSLIGWLEEFGSENPWMVRVIPREWIASSKDNWRMIWEDNATSQTLLECTDQEDPCPATSRGTSKCFQFGSSCPTEPPQSWHCDSCFQFPCALRRILWTRQAASFCRLDSISRKAQQQIPIYGPAMTRPGWEMAFVRPTWHKKSYHSRYFKLQTILTRMGFAFMDPWKSPIVYVHLAVESIAPVTI